MYSIVYGAVVAVLTIVLAQFVDGRVALVIGLVLIALRWAHLRARASFERQVFGGLTAEERAKANPRQR